MAACTLSSAKQIILLGVVTALCCTPLLFKHDEEEMKEGSAFLRTVQSNKFENMILITIALSIPSILDVLADLCEKKNIHVFDDEQLIRIFISLSLLSQPLLFYHFSIRSENLIATYAIKNIRAICCATIVAEQLHMHCGQVFTYKISISMLFLWSFGNVVGSYSIYKDPITDVAAAIAIVTKGSGGVILTVNLCRHYISMSKDLWNNTANIDHRYQNWHNVAFELLIILTLVGNSAFDIIYSFNNIYEFCETYIVATAYLASFFQFLYSNLMTQHFRFELAVTKEKLAIKRQFVRYVSHEVRTPLNSCSLGLLYLRSMCTSTAPSVVSSENFCSEMVKVIDEITDSCDTAVHFMNNMLFYEKVDTLDLRLYFNQENLNDLCKKAHQAFFLSSRHLNIDLILDIHKSLVGNEARNPYIRADQAKIMVVFRNLLSNALKFSAPNGRVKFRVVPIYKMAGKSGSGTIDPSLHDWDLPPSLSEENTTHYRVIVQDEGIGMSLQEQRDLFSGVIQFNPNESQSGGGSGMGLYLSQRIVMDHGTIIKVYSEGIRGKGSTFYIDFPKVKKNKEDNRPANKKTVTPKVIDKVESSSYIESQMIKPYSNSTRVILSRPLAELDIMIVDDSSITRKMLQRTFQHHQIGGTFSQACDGVELLNIMCPSVMEGQESGTSPTLSSNRDERKMSSSKKSLLQNDSKCKIHPSLLPEPSVLLKSYDIIIMDKCMPLLNGDVATAKLRELGYQGLIFGLTGNALPEDLQDFCDMGANFAFSKPLDMKMFLQILDEYYLK